jgi:hypothetical protein
MATRETFPVETTGVGRKDYSQQVEYSVEPIVRSYQNAYLLDEIYLVPAGSVRTIDVNIPSETVVLLYDFIASISRNCLLGFEVQAIDVAGGLANPIFSKADYQKVEHHHSRGAPVFLTIRIILTNYCTFDLDVSVTLAGIYTGVQEYHQSVAT